MVCIYIYGVYIYIIVSIYVCVQIYIYTYPQHTTWFFIEVYFGFFVVSNIYGGGAPKDLLPFIVPGPWIKMIIGEITAVV